MSVYIPPQAKVTLVLEMLHYINNKQLLMAHPDDVMMVAGDFSHANLKHIMPKIRKETIS